MIVRCNECNTILFKIQNSCIIMVSRHHGQQHINVIPITDLVKLLEREGVPPSPSSPTKQGASTFADQLLEEHINETVDRAL